MVNHLEKNDWTGTMFRKEYHGVLDLWVFFVQN